MDHSDFLDDESFPTRFDSDDYQNSPTKNDTNKSTEKMKHKNMSKINRDAEKPVQREAEKLDDISKNNKEIDEFYQEMIDKDWGLIEKMTNGDMYKQVQAVQKNLLNRSADYRLKFYEQVLETRLTALKERCSHGLVAIKAHYRSQLTTFMGAKLHELKVQMAQRQQDFMELMKEKHDYMKTFEDYPELQESYREEVLGEEKHHMKFLSKLIDHFESIIDEEVNHGRS